MEILKTIVCSLVLFTNVCFSQKQGNIWYFGEGAGLDFNTAIPTPIFGGNIFPYPVESGEATIAEGSASICDSTGSLLFYSNGEKIWNRNHDIMPNGNDLMGMYSSTQSSFIIPQPLSDSIFYVFTTDGLERNLEGGLRYSIVNMCLDNGMGDVVSQQKNILLLDTVAEKLAAVKHQNGKDFWLISHKYGSNAFHAFLISENGIVDTVITNIGSVHLGLASYAAIGQMKISPDGTKLALVFSNVVPAVAEFFNFDKSTGILSNHISLTTENNSYGVEFSPDNSKLYITNVNGLHQFDLLAGGGAPSSINASKTNIPMSYLCMPIGLQLGPDDKIYVSRCTTFVSVISSPNNVGISCNFVDNAINFGSTTARVSFPSFISGFDYHNGIYNCETSSVESKTSNFQFKLFPNPASQSVYLVYDNPQKERYSVVIYRVDGLIVNQISNIIENEVLIDLANFASGLYYFQVYEQDNLIFSDKLIIN